MQPASCRSVHQTARHFPPERAGTLCDYQPCVGVLLSGEHRSRLQFLCRQTDPLDLPDNACHYNAYMEISHPSGGKRYLPLRLCMLLILGGAVGNLIDRIRNQYVVDFIYFVPIDFPKFNVADIYITVGVAILAALLFFYYTDEELEALFAVRSKN